MNNNELTALALQIAQGQVGQSEQPIGSNSGPMVNEYLKAVGLNPGYAWCQAFVYWCYREAAGKLNRGNPLIHTAGVHDCWNKSLDSPFIKRLARENAIKTPGSILPGMQFILLFGTTEGHTGIVEKTEVTATGLLIHTIEGNSNTNGSREGYEVVRHIRKPEDKALAGFIQYT
jgi:hypothetical protein